MKFVPVNTNRQKKSVYYLFLIIFYTDLFLALFPAWSGSFVYNYMSRTLFMNIWLLGALSIFLLSAILILCIQKKNIQSNYRFYNYDIKCMFLDFYHY